MVSVVIPTYNHRAYVLETLDSVFAQTFSDYEVIVVNDGSPDDTAEVLRPLADAGRIRYFEQENHGQAAARNRGAELARGSYLAFLDDDDVWEPDALESLMDIAESSSDTVLVYGQMQTFGDPLVVIFPDENAPTGQVHKAFLVGNSIGTPGQVVIRRSAFERVGGFDPAIWGADDWELWIRLGALGPFSFNARVVLNYRVHPLNASKQLRRMRINCRKVVDKHLPSTCLKSSQMRREAMRNVDKFIRSSAKFQAIRHGLSGRWGAARQSWLNAIQLAPSLLTERVVWKSLLRSLIG